MALADEDYSALERMGGDSYLRVSVAQCQDLMRECDNRRPEAFSLKMNDPEFEAMGELEVVENKLREILKNYKNAKKKTAPQSAWKPAYASLEALTLFIKTNTSWFDVKDRARAEDAFKAFGAAWVSSADSLSKLGILNESSFPSIRSGIATAMTIGASLNEKHGKKINGWPEKLEGIWTGSDVDERKKKPAADDDGDKKKSGKGKKKGEEEEVDDKKKSKKAAKEAAASNPYDIESVNIKKKATSDYDISSWTEDQRVKMVMAA